MWHSLTLLLFAVVEVATLAAPNAVPNAAPSLRWRDWELRLDTSEFTRLATLLNDDGTLQRPAAGSKLLLATPGGPYPADCVTVVPSGTSVEEVHAFDGSTVARYTLPSGKVVQRPACEWLSELQPLLARHALRSNASGTTIGGHAYPVAYMGYTPSNITNFEGKYNTPDSPSHDVGQTLYYWLGGEPDDASYVIQPVLGYNGNGKYAWSVASWDCCPGGHKHMAVAYSLKPGTTFMGSFKEVAPGLYLTVGGSSILWSSVSPPVRQAVISLEVYKVTDCNQLATSEWDLPYSLSPYVERWGNYPEGWQYSECGLTPSNSNNKTIIPGM